MAGTDESGTSGGTTPPEETLTPLSTENQVMKEALQAVALSNTKVADAITNLGNVTKKPDDEESDSRKNWQVLTFVGIVLIVGILIATLWWQMSAEGKMEVAAQNAVTTAVEPIKARLDGLTNKVGVIDAFYKNKIEAHDSQLAKFVTKEDFAAATAATKSTVETILSSFKLQEEFNQSTTEKIQNLETATVANTAEIHRSSTGWKSEAEQIRNKIPAAAPVKVPTTVVPVITPTTSYYMDLWLYNAQGMLQDRVNGVKLQDVAQQGNLTRFVSEGKIRDWYQPVLKSYAYSDNKEVGMIVYTDSNNCVMQLLRVSPREVFRDPSGGLLYMFRGNLLRAPQGAEFVPVK